MNGVKKSLGLGHCFAIFVLATLNSLPSAAQVFNDGRDGFTTEKDDDLPDRDPENTHWEYLGEGFACHVRIDSLDVISVVVTSEQDCQGTRMPGLNICFEPSGSGRLSVPCMRPEHHLVDRGGISQPWTKSSWLDVLNRSINGELKLMLFGPSDGVPVNGHQQFFASKAAWASPHY